MFMAHIPNTWSGKAPSSGNFSLSSENKPRLGKPGARYTVPGAEPEPQPVSKAKSKKSGGKGQMGNSSVASQAAAVSRAEPSGTSSLPVTEGEVWQHILACISSKDTIVHYIELVSQILLACNSLSKQSIFCMEVMAYEQLSQPFSIRQKCDEWRGIDERWLGSAD